MKECKIQAPDAGIAFKAAIKAGLIPSDNTDADLNAVYSERFTDFWVIYQVLLNKKTEEALNNKCQRRAQKHKQYLKYSLSFFVGVLGALLILFMTKGF